MLIAPAAKISKSFDEYLKCVTEKRGPVVITSDDDVPIAALVRLKDRRQIAHLFNGRSVASKQRRMLRRQEADRPNKGPTVEQVLSDPTMLALYQSHIKPRFEKLGRVYTTDTPDIRVAIPGRRKSSVIAVIRPRKKCLKSLVRKGKKMAAYDIFPNADIPSDLDNWLERARKYTDRM